MRTAVLSEVVADGSPDVRREAIELCRIAYGEDLTQLFEVTAPAVHVLVRDGGALVSHAMWSTRWLQVGDGPLLRTAYVEAVATHPGYRRRGLASRVMRRLIAEIPDELDLAALSPATIPLYERLGWKPWLGPLLERMPDGTVVATPDEEMVMVYEPPGRPPVDRRQPLSVEWRVGEVW